MSCFRDKENLPSGLPELYPMLVLKSVTSENGHPLIGFNQSRFILSCCRRAQPPLMRHTFFPQPKCLNKIRDINKNASLDHEVESNGYLCKEMGTAKSLAPE